VIQSEQSRTDFLRAVIAGLLGPFGILESNIVPGPGRPRAQPREDYEWIEYSLSNNRPHDGFDVGTQFARYLRDRHKRPNGFVTLPGNHLVPSLVVQDRGASARWTAPQYPRPMQTVDVCCWIRRMPQ